MKNSSDAAQNIGLMLHPFLLLAKYDAFQDAMIHKLDLPHQPRDETPQLHHNNIDKLSLHIVVFTQWHQPTILDTNTTITKIK